MCAECWTRNLDTAYTIFGLSRQDSVSTYSRPTLALTASVPKKLLDMQLIALCATMVHHQFMGVKETMRRVGYHPDPWISRQTAAKIPIGAALTCDDYRCRAMIIPAERRLRGEHSTGGRRNGSGPGRRTGRCRRTRAVRTPPPGEIWRKKLNAGGDVAASISASGPAFRIPADRIGQAEPGLLHLGTNSSRQRIPCCGADDVGSPACPSHVSGRVKPAGNGSVGSRPIWEMPVIQARV